MGAWSWGVGGNGGDRVFGNTLTKEDLWPVFRRGMELGLNSMGHSCRVRNGCF
ncbi:hypothetical protein [uncultured Dialister sp.]|uniref:hypothetical protein n=1 Tax=Dialister hominis TaxID=2582419 RepID=UPI0025973CE1|nr:hypothetical protein [uncultured Dialister sp.]